MVPRPFNSGLVRTGFADNLAYRSAEREVGVFRMLGLYDGTAPDATVIVLAALRSAR